MGMQLFFGGGDSHLILNRWYFTWVPWDLTEEQKGHEKRPSRWLHHPHPHPILHPIKLLICGHHLPGKGYSGCLRRDPARKCLPLRALRNDKYAVTMPCFQLWDQRMPESERPHWKMGKLRRTEGRWLAWSDSANLEQGPDRMWVSCCRQLTLWPLSISSPGETQDS